MKPEDLAKLSTEERAALVKSLESAGAVSAFDASAGDSAERGRYVRALKVAKSANASPLSRAGALEVLKNIDLATGHKYREQISSKALLIANLNCPYAELLLRKGSETINNVVFQYTSWSTSAEADYTQANHEFSMDDVVAADINQRQFTGKCATLAIKSQVSELANAHVLPDGEKVVDKNIMNSAFAALRQLNTILIDGDVTVNAKHFNGLNAHQKAEGDSELRTSQGGSSLTFALVNEMVTKAQTLGNAELDYMILNPYDVEALRLEKAGRNTETGSKNEKLISFTSTTGGEIKFLVDTKVDSVKKLPARAENVAGAVKFTGDISAGDEVIVAGVTYTAAAAQNISGKEFKAGTAIVAMASLIQVISAYNVNGGNAQPIAVGTDAVNFVSVKMGTIGNDYTVTATGTNITVNAATFAGGKDSTVYLIDSTSIALQEFEIAGKKGFQSHIVNNGDYNQDRRDVTWIGGVAYYNPKGLVVIENVG